MNTSDPRHRRLYDHARPGFAMERSVPLCCDLRQPGCECWACGKGPDDQPISANRALASNA